MKVLTVGKLVLNKTMGISADDLLNKTIQRSFGLILRLKNWSMQSLKSDA